MTKTTGAGYKPQEFIIRLGSEIQMFDSEKNALVAPTPNALAVFMHEYMHYIHNVSTLIGVSALINTLEFWRLFRCTFDENGFSLGSTHLDATAQDCLKLISEILAAGRGNYKPQFNNVLKPASLKILNATPEKFIISKQGTQLTKYVCQAQVLDQGGNAENCQIEIGIPEIMEAAAWLLECRLLSKLVPDTDLMPVDVLPYKAVSALADHLYPGIKQEAVLAAILASLQSSDPVDALQQVLNVACGEDDSDQDVTTKIHQVALKIVTDNEAALLSLLSEIKAEFSTQNIMSTGIDAILARAHEALAIRRRLPLFEIALIDALANGDLSFEQWMKEYPSCAVIQQNAGANDVLKRDTLASFLPLNEDDSDPEDGLRVVHAIFDFVGRHSKNGEFIPTAELEAKPCPFFTCCDLDVRKHQSDICRNSPWGSVGQYDGGNCWYGAAVAITRPPPNSLPLLG